MWMDILGRSRHGRKITCSQQGASNIPAVAFFLSNVHSIIYLRSSLLHGRSLPLCLTHSKRRIHYSLPSYSTDAVRTHYSPSPSPSRSPGTLFSPDLTYEFRVFCSAACNGGEDQGSQSVPLPLLTTFLTVRQSYAAAIIRFVNGLVDPLQLSTYARPIASIAAQIGLPQRLVELRHAATHEELPSLDVLRDSARMVRIS